MSNQAFEFHDWIEETKEHWITVQDVMSMLNDPNPVKLLVLDRNVGDIVCANNPPDQQFKPFHFFRKNWMMYIHNEGMHGNSKFEFMNEYKPFEFEIEYAPGSWYPLENGFLPPNDPQGFANFGESGGKHWTAFGPNAHVGCRGPMILWSDLQILPDVYWTNYEE